MRRVTLAAASATLAAVAVGGIAWHAAMMPKAEYDVIVELPPADQSGEEAVIGAPGTEPGGQANGESTGLELPTPPPPLAPPADAGQPAKPDAEEEAKAQADRQAQALALSRAKTAAKQMLAAEEKLLADASAPAESPEITGLDQAKASLSESRARQYESVIKLYSQAIRSGKLSGDNLLTAYRNRGKAYFRQREYDTAIDDYDRAIELNPKDAALFDARGSAYYHKADYERAISDYTEAIRLQPEDANPYYNRCLAYARTARKSEAIDDCQTALRFKPDDPDIRKALDYLGAPKPN